MQTACALGIFRILNLHLLEEFYDFKMPVICCVIQTVEPLHVLVILTLFHRALHEYFNDVQTKAQQI